MGFTFFAEDVEQWQWGRGSGGDTPKDNDLDHTEKTKVKSFSHQSTSTPHTLAPKTPRNFANLDHPHVQISKFLGSRSLSVLIGLSVGRSVDVKVMWVIHVIHFILILQTMIS